MNKLLKKEDTTLKAVGQKIMLHRVDQGMTIQALSEKCKVNVILISSIEKNKANNVNIGTLKDITRALGLTLRIDAE